MKSCFGFDAMKVIEVQNLTVNLPILSVNARSLRKTVMNLSTGGRLLRDSRDKIHVQALSGVSFDLAAGDRLGVIGHNGSGKSTLLRTLGKIYRPSSGLVVINGKVATILDPAAGLNFEITGRENIGLLGRFHGLGKKEIEAALEDIADFTGLGDFLNVPIKTYSQGMIARLAFSVGTQWRPEVVLMDEWIAVADENFKTAALERLTNFVSSARAVVLASHDYILLRRLCNKVLILEHGAVRYFGPIESSILAAA